jgi:hypothetical protein
MISQSDQNPATAPEPEYPRYRSHFRPRTWRGWVAVVLFLGILALAQPPLVNTIANRIEPLVLGMPFLYAYLLVIYCALIAVLLWAQHKGL